MSYTQMMPYCTSLAEMMLYSTIHVEMVSNVSVMAYETFQAEKILCFTSHAEMMSYFTYHTTLSLLAMIARCCYYEYFLVDLLF